MAILLRLCLFWVKIISGNAFPKMRVFGWSGKLNFLEIDFRWPKKKGFDYGNEFPFLFSLQMNSGERERERERAREGEAYTHQRRSHALSSSLLRSQAPAPSIAISRHRLRSHLRADREIMPSIAISPSRRSQSMLRAVEHRRTPSKPVERERQFGCCVCFSGFVFFLVAFSKHQKIFFRKFFEIQPNT